MPQCVSRKNTDAPCGKGTRATELMESTLRMRQRTAQINKTANIRLQSYTDMIEKRRQAEEARKLRLIERTRRTLEEIRAYQKVSKLYLELYTYNKNNHTNRQNNILYQDDGGTN